MDLRVKITDENGDKLQDVVIYQDGSDSEGAARIATFIRHTFDVDTDAVAEGTSHEEMNPDEIQVQVDRAELATILAALRHYQHEGFGDPNQRPGHLHDIATNGGTLASSLDDEDIDGLCQRLNCG